jgi:hypothetical protein
MPEVESIRSVSEHCQQICGSENTSDLTTKSEGQAMARLQRQICASENKERITHDGSEMRDRVENRASRWKRARGRPIEFDWRLGAAIAVLGSNAGSLRGLESWLRWPARSTLRHWRSIEPAFDVLLSVAFRVNDARMFEERARSLGDLEGAVRLHQTGARACGVILEVLRWVGEGCPEEEIRAFILRGGKAERARI